MSLISGDASDFYRLAGDLSQIGFKAVGPMRQVMGAAGEAFVKEWMAGARATSGAHGVHYPDSIESQPIFGVTTMGVDVGPNPSKPQGGMSFEHGSVNQPPHLDGLKALERVAPRVERMFDAAVGVLFK